MERWQSGRGERGAAGPSGPTDPSALAWAEASTATLEQVHSGPTPRGAGDGNDRHQHEVEDASRAGGPLARKAQMGGGSVQAHRTWKGVKPRALQQHKAAESGGPSVSTLG